MDTSSSLHLLKLSFLNRATVQPLVATYIREFSRFERHFRHRRLPQRGGAPLKLLFSRPCGFMSDTALVLLSISHDARARVGSFCLLFLLYRVTGKEKYSNYLLCDAVECKVARDCGEVSGRTRAAIDGVMTRGEIFPSEEEPQHWIFHGREQSRRLNEHIAGIS